MIELTLGNTTVSGAAAAVALIGLVVSVVGAVGTLRAAWAVATEDRRAAAMAMTGLGLMAGGTVVAVAMLVAFGSSTFP